MEQMDGFFVYKELRKVMELVKEKVDEEFKNTKLTGTQGMILAMLAHNGRLKISEISECLCLSNSTVSGIIDRMEEKGYVERTRSQQDRRVVYVSATDEYDKKARQTFKTIDQKLSNIINNATPDQLEKVHEGLNILKVIFQESRGDKV